MLHKCHQCDRLFAEKECFDEHMKGHEKPLICGLCRKMFLDRTTLARHAMKLHTERNPCKCITCDEIFESETNLNAHIDKHINDWIRENSENNSTKSLLGDMQRLQDHCCFICAKKFTTTSDLKKHIKSHSDNRPFVCGTCGRSFKRQSHLKSHQLIHTGEKPNKCSMCDYRSVQQNALKTHMKIHNQNNPFCCPWCTKSFSLLCRMKTHMLDNEEKQLSCKVCDSEFNHMCALKNHMKNSHVRRGRGGGPLHACSICSKQFGRKTTLDEHLTIHSSEKPFSCNICKKDYANQSLIRNHIESHIGEDSFACTACNITFENLMAIKRHMKMHIVGQPEYLCTQCNQKLIGFKVYRQHKKSHDANKLNRCDTCGKILKTEAGLRVHILNHRNFYQCPECKNQFATKENLITHLKRKHL